MSSLETNVHRLLIVAGTVENMRILKQMKLKTEQWAGECRILFLWNNGYSHKMKSDQF